MDEVDGNVVGQIGKGLCVLIGIHTDDTDVDMEYMYVWQAVYVRLVTFKVAKAFIPVFATIQYVPISRSSVRKILNLRLFEDDKGQMWKKVRDMQANM